MSVEMIIITILSWCLANLLITLLFITSMGESIRLDNLLGVILAMLFNIIPVFIAFNFIKSSRPRAAHAARHHKVN